MKKERNEYIQIIKDLNGDIKGRKAALDFIKNSDIWVHGKPAPFPYVPNLFNAADLEYLNNVCKITHGILCKVISQYINSPDYRKLFAFSPELERLIMLPCNYEQMLPMGRFDIFLDQECKNFKFCEFNTDGSGAMSRDFMISSALELGETYKRFAAKHHVEKFELINSWVETFMEIYKSDANAVKNPNVCITDFEESGVFSDFNRFIEAFKQHGINARFVDVRKFEFNGKHLIDPSDGTVIHAIYRRAVTSEILQHPGECDALIDAVAAGKVCLIGHFRTTVVHSKVINIVLFDERTRSFLNKEECEFIDKHVPRTYRFTSKSKDFDLNEVKANKDNWIIKPEDDYGAHGVFPGVDFEQNIWEQIVEKHLDSSYVLQEFCKPPLVDIIRPEAPEDGDLCKVEKWQSMPGFYQYNGKLAGFYCRQGQEGVIAIDHGGLCVSSFKVDC